MKRIVVVIVLGMLLVVGCAMARHREQVREGLFTVGLNREAFIKEWGMPEKTESMTGGEFSKFNAQVVGNVGSAGYTSGTAYLDVWTYEKGSIVLIFHGRELVGWKTDKTREELKTISKKRSE